MILDIRYFDKSPEQIQGVKSLVIYVRNDSKLPPEFVIVTSQDKPTRYVDTANVWTVAVTND